MKRDRSVVRLIVYLYKLISFNLNCLKREFEILMRKNYTLQLFFTYLKLYPIINIACWLFLPLCAIFAPQTGKRLFLGHRRKVTNRRRWRDRDTIFLTTWLTNLRGWDYEHNYISGEGASQVSRAVRERAAPLSFSLSPSSLLGKRDTSHPSIVSKNTLEKRKEETSIEGGSRKKPFWTRPFPLVKIMPTGRNCKTGT